MLTTNQVATSPYFGNCVMFIFCVHILYVWCSYFVRLDQTKIRIRKLNKTLYPDPLRIREILRISAPDPLRDHLCLECEYHRKSSVYLKKIYIILKKPISKCYKIFNHTFKIVTRLLLQKNQT